jgi:hypothetical protein
MINQIIMVVFSLKKQFMNSQEAETAIRNALEQSSGKPVVIIADPNCSGYASIKTASDNDPAHLLRYKPEFEAELMYLSSFQCGMALRSIQAKSENRFDLTSTPAMEEEVKSLIEEHLRRADSSIPLSVVPQLCQQLGHGLGLQLRSMPLAIRIDEWLLREYPALASLQRKNIERQLQEAMQALGPSVRAFAPQRIIDANAGMSCAFAKFWAFIWDEPEIAIPFVSAGYDKIGEDLLSLVRTVDQSPDGDRELVNQWSERLGLTGWFQIIDRN